MIMLDQRHIPAHPHGIVIVADPQQIRAERVNRANVQICYIYTHVLALCHLYKVPPHGVGRKCFVLRICLHATLSCWVLFIYLQPYYVEARGCRHWKGGRFEMPQTTLRVHAILCVLCLIEALTSFSIHNIRWCGCSDQKHILWT